MRGPLFPNFDVPHVLDFEDHLKWWRFYDKLTAEAVMNLKIFPYYNFFHP